MPQSIYELVPGLAKASAATAAPPAGKIRVLRQLDLAEVSLCDDGANQGAKIVLFKRNSSGGGGGNDGGSEMPVDIAKAIQSAEAGRFGPGMREEYLAAFRELQANVAKARGISESAALPIVAASSEGEVLYEGYKRASAAVPDSDIMKSYKDAGTAAEAELERRADALQAADPKLSRQAARGKALLKNPRLSRAIEDGRRATGTYQGDRIR
jgi:hypothetical protein